MANEARPLCPKCGTPAIVVVVEKARVRCAIDDDGEPRKVLSCSRASKVVGYECGGGHEYERKVD